MIQVLRLFGNLPMMLELSMNYCTQGCEYCYAKTWRREEIPLEKVMNDILRQEVKKEGLLPWLIQRRSAIALSNRTDVMCATDWRERLSALKRMGFPLYIETKLTEEYRDLADILDPKTDMIYQTITGFSDKYEERNHLSPEEKVDAAKFFVARGFHTAIGVNPFMPDKCSADDVKRLMTEIRPRSGLVMHDYHTTSKFIDRHLFPPEFPKEPMAAARREMMRWCAERKIPHDIQDWHRLGADECDTEWLQRKDENDFMFGGKHFVFNEFLAAVQRRFKENPDVDIIDVTFGEFMDFYAEQVDYFRDAVITFRDYKFHIKDKAGQLAFFGGKERFGIEHFLRSMWNAGEMKMVFDWYKEKGKPRLDKDGNMVYFRLRDGFYSDVMKGLDA